MRRRQRQVAAQAHQAAASAWLNEMSRALDDRLVTYLDEVVVDMREPVEPMVVTVVPEAIVRPKKKPARSQATAIASRPRKAAGVSRAG